MVQHISSTPWKAWNYFSKIISLPVVRLIFAFNRIPWSVGWNFFGIPIIQKHRQSLMLFGNGLSLRSIVRSNPLGPNHPVILCTWQPEAKLTIGDDFGMTGGNIVAAEQITIGNRVVVGANCIIIDTDFHPLDSEQRCLNPQIAKTAPIVIEDDVFIGMNSLILKGIRIGKGAVIGAGSVVTRDVPTEVIVAGNPAQVIRHIDKR